MVKSIKLEVVTDPSDFPYYRASMGQTKLNFAKIDDVLEFVKRHMTVDTDMPLLKERKAEIIYPKEKQPSTTGVAKSTWGPKTVRHDKLCDEILIFAGIKEGVTNEMLSEATGVHYSDVSKACCYLERLGKLRVMEGSRKPKRWQTVP